MPSSSHAIDFPGLAQAGLDSGDSLAASEPLRPLDSALIARVAWGDADGARACLAAGANPNASDESGGTALHYAAQVGNAACVALLEPLSEPDARNQLGETPLMRAMNCSSKENQACAVILLRRADPRAIDLEGWNALMRAVMCRSMELTRLLLPLSDPLAASTMGITPFLLGCLAGRTDLLLLLAPLSDIRACTDRGDTAFDLLAQNTTEENAPDRLPALRELIRLLPDWAGQAQPGRLSPLALFAKNGALECAQALAPLSAGILRKAGLEHPLSVAVAAERALCADWLAPLCERAVAEQALAVLGCQKMPRFASLLESEAIRGEMEGSVSRAKKSESAGAGDSGAGLCLHGPAREHFHGENDDMGRLAARPAPRRI